MANIGKKYAFVAVPARNDNGFLASYEIPGLTSDFVRDSAGAFAFYDHGDAARVAAAERMTYIINRPLELARSSKKDFKFPNLGGPAFSEAVGRANVTLATLAHVTGQRLERMNTWITGIDEKSNADGAAHWMRTILAIFEKHPKALQTAIDVSEASEIKTRAA